MRKLLIITLLAMGSTLFAQNTKNLTEDVVNNIRENYKQKAENDKGVRNALSNNDIRSLAVNNLAVLNFRRITSISGICSRSPTSSLK